VIGLASSGAHSNGFSLIRKVIATSTSDLYETYNGGTQTLGEALLEPTRIYVKPVLAVLDEVKVKGMAHITGGGLSGTSRACCRRRLARGSTRRAGARRRSSTGFKRHGRIEADEMHATFNCGIGMVLVVAKGNAKAAPTCSRHPAWTRGRAADRRARGSGPQVVVV